MRTEEANRVTSERKRWFQAAWYLLPVAFLFWLYADSVHIWFREDDFPLLYFVRQVHNAQDLVRALFAPYAQGTIRPLSERLPFLLSNTFFDLDSVPFRLGVLATAALDIVLIAWVAQKLTGSRLAGLAAAFFWAASPAIVSPMTWNSSYNQVQFPLFLLAALACFIKYAETGRKAFWWWQSLFFVLGLGSLETMVVYPALAASWAFFVANRSRRTRLLVSTIPLFGIAAVYSLIHLQLIRPSTDDLYALHFDGRIFRTLWEYWRWAFLSPEWAEYRYPAPLGLFILIAGMAGILLFSAWQLYKKRAAVLFCLAWFLILLAPVLLLPNRHSEYYLAVPAIGLALLAGFGVEKAFEAGWLWRISMLIVVLPWFAGMLSVVRASTSHWVGESRLSQALVLGVQAAQQTHPQKAILLDGMTDQLYRIAIQDRGFRVVGANAVYLTPGSGSTIHTFPGDEDFQTLILDPAVAIRALHSDQAVVYTFAGDHLRNITSRFAVNFPPDVTPRRIEVGEPLYAYLLGPEWMSPADRVRWMPERASLTIGRPAAPGAKLILSGYCSAQQLKGQLPVISVSADGLSLGETQLARGEEHFLRTFPVPPALTGEGMMTITISVKPVLHVGGLSYGILGERIEIQP